MFKQEVLKLLDSTTPFLSPSGQKVVQSVQYLAELIQSPLGTKALNSLSNLGEATGTLATGKAKSPQNNPYALFLVFYLLILATDHDAPSPGSLAAVPNPQNELPGYKSEEEQSINP